MYIENWVENFKELYKYYRKFNNLDVPYDYRTKRGVNLYSWLSRQVTAYKSGTLSKKQVEVLNQIGFKSLLYGKRWSHMIPLLQQYFAKYNNIVFFKNYYAFDGVNIGKFIENMRIKYANNELDKYQIDTLENLNIIWDSDLNCWYVMYREALKYYNDNGNLLVPKYYKTRDAYALGSWISSQRINVESLNDKQIELLNDIEMIWDIDEYTFFEMYRLAYSYYVEHGNLNIKREYQTSDNKPLGHWVNKMRLEYKKGNLDEERIILLQNIGIVWDYLDNSLKALHRYSSNLNWMEFYELAKKYYKEHNDLLVPSNYKLDNNSKLGYWISNQRINVDSLTDEQINMLNKIGMVWNINNNNAVKKRHIKKNN